MIEKILKAVVLKVIVPIILGVFAIRFGELWSGVSLIGIGLIFMVIEDDVRKNLLNLIVSFIKSNVEKVSEKSNNVGSQVMDNSDSNIQNSVTGANVSNVGGDVIQNINIVNENQKNIK